MNDITALMATMKAAAEKATPGRWEYFPGNTSIEYNVDSMDEDQGSIVYVDSGDFTQAQTDRNGEFIALSNPANVLALVEALEKAQSQAIQQGNIACALFDEVTAQRQRIAELESRTVNLPRRVGAKSSWQDGPLMHADKVIAALRAAGIQVIEGEGQHGGNCE